MIGNWNYGTGRRKSSVARVFIKKGTGQILVNGKPVEQYFGRQTSIMIVKQPLMLTNNDTGFDVKVNVHGGGEVASSASWNIQKRIEAARRRPRNLCTLRAGSGGQRLLNCLRRRAPCKPTFLRSTSRASRVTKPAWLSWGFRAAS